MYYNPETQKTASKEDIMVLLNASFPDSTAEIGGWHLVDESLLYPSLEQNQFAVPESIELHDGIYARTYSIQECANPVPSHSGDGEESLQEKYERLEQAFLDLAQIVSNLEDYRMLAEKEREEAIQSESEEPIQ